LERVDGAAVDGGVIAGEGIDAGGDVGLHGDVAADYSGLREVVSKVSAYDLAAL